MRWLTAAALGLALLASPVALAQDASASFSIEGQVKRPRAVALADLEAFPPVSVTLKHDKQAASYTGALLWALVSAAGPTDLPGDRTHAQHTLLARGRDGYAVALAIGELDPNLEGKQVLVAYEQDGHRLATPRLVVPGEAHPARSVKDLVAIEVR